MGYRDDGEGKKEGGKEGMWWLWDNNDKHICEL